MNNQLSFTLRGRNPDVLTCIANLSNDEVFTPPEFANRMLDTLAEAWAAANSGANIWADSSVRFLDPFTKSGVFLREITSLLTEGLATEIPDLQQRVDHILTRQVFGIGITQLTSLLARRSVYCSKHANGPHSIAKGFASETGNIWFERMEHTWVAAHNQGHEGMQQLVPFGDGGELKAVLEATDSELLQISGVCQNAEFFPEEDIGNAVYRQAEYCDATLILEKKSAVFLLFNEKEKLVATNAFLRNLAVQMNPENPWLGKRDVIALIDAKKSLSEHFGMDISCLLPESAKSLLSAGKPQTVDLVEISSAPRRLLSEGAE